MKKVIVVLLTLVMCIPLFAERYRIGDGLTLVTYGNTAVIEDDNTQQSISLSIERREDSNGRPVYDLFCGNKYTKGIMKTSLQVAISSIITSAAASVGASGGPAGAAAGASIGATISKYANNIASNIYDDVCDYYKDR
ncbi:MAG: hypothetical protein IJ047_02725 [Paludibacteraceae bacterium]|nr:hypothetical protein [Paludibacteraceae bacterium]